MKQRAILFFFIGIMTGILQAQTLTLKDAGQLFLKQNLSLIAARYDMDIAQAQVLQARLFENPVISLEQNVYNRLNGKYFDMGKDGESGVEIEQVISIAGQRSNRIRLEKRLEKQNPEAMRKWREWKKRNCGSTIRSLRNMKENVGFRGVCMFMSRNVR